ncbi:hypothetical protein JCM17846_19180 [Iodidimonas nitroreducens]|uniref:Uncharacterized protein n=1 Tax=Iodidimonas nitroreducens TaxID=1236968 RepID=A0A5A7NBB1_9PROT|nr:hypothetical protein [Iodidimonas nitroreducens]GER04236.1 hypothetical protein JCM17846_19180 [Iodidimonas nitroreducens]
MTALGDDGPEGIDHRWPDAMTAAALLLIDPVGLGGVHLRAHPGPVRDAWLAALLEMAADAGIIIRPCPGQISQEALAGGLDLIATLKSGKPVHSPGLLAQADGGLVLLRMADRLLPSVAGQMLPRLIVLMHALGWWPLMNMKRMKSQPRWC